MTETASASLERLRTFSSTFNSGDMVDEESGLTADDLSRVVHEMDVHLGNVILLKLDADKEPPAVRDNDLAALVLALSESVGRMARYYNSRFDDEPLAEQVEFHRTWNAALKTLSEKTARFARSHCVEG